MIQELWDCLEDQGLQVYVEQEDPQADQGWTECLVELDHLEYAGTTGDREKWAQRVLQVRPEFRDHKDLEVIGASQVKMATLDLPAP